MADAGSRRTDPARIVLLQGPRSRTLSGRYVTLAAGEIVSKLCVLAAFAWLARVLGPGDFGLIELSLAVTLVFVLLTEAGLGSYGARIVAAAPERTPRLIARVMLIRAALALPAYAAILALSARYGMPGLGVLAIYGLTVLAVPLYTQWVFQGLGHMRWVAAGTVARNVVFAACVFAFVAARPDARLAALAELCGVLALVLVNAYVLHVVLRVRIDWDAAPAGAVELFSDAWFLGVSDLAWAGLWYSPEIVLGALAGTSDVAWLAGPLRVVLALHTFVWLYFFNLLPALSRALGDSLGTWRDLARRSLGTSMWLACLIALGGTLLAPLVIRVVYGEGFAPAVLPLRIVIWMVPVAWLSGHFRYTLIAGGRQGLECAGAVLAAAAGAILAVLWVPAAGSAGAAAALLSGGVINAWITGAIVARRVGSMDVLRAVWPALSACVVCLAGGLALGTLAGPLTGTAGALLSFATIAGTRDPELARLRRDWLSR
jgi:PST family polysaccharide transporter